MIANEVEVQETYGSRGHYYYIVCPVCGTREKVVYDWEMYGGLPRYSVDGDEIIWSDEEKALYPIVDTELNEEDVENAMGEGENAPYE